MNIKSDNWAHSLLRVCFISVVPRRTRKTLRAYYIGPSRSPKSGMLEFHRREVKAVLNLGDSSRLSRHLRICPCWLMRCGEMHTISTVHCKLLTYPLTSSVFYETLRMFPPVWLGGFISIVRYQNSSLPSDTQHPEIERRRYDTHRWQCCWRETYNPSSKRSSYLNWCCWPSLQS